MPSSASSAWARAHTPEPLTSGGPEAKAPWLGLGERASGTNTSPKTLFSLLMPPAAAPAKGVQRASLCFSERLWGSPQFYELEFSSSDSKTSCIDELPPAVGQGAPARERFQAHSSLPRSAALAEGPASRLLGGWLHQARHQGMPGTCDGFPEDGPIPSAKLTNSARASHSVNVVPPVLPALI